MKKIIALAIAVLMLAALAVPAFAVETADATGTNTQSSADTNVTYAVTQKYTFTVPADITLGETGKAGNEVTASGVTLYKGHKLTITTSETAQMKADDSEATADITLSKYVFDFTAADTQSFDITWTAPTVAGNYKTTLTFAAAIVEVAPQG